MRTGATVSGGAHALLIGLAIIGGEFFDEQDANPVNIAEIELMTGTEFEAAFSAAPVFDPDLPPAPQAPEDGPERVDVKVADEDSAPSTLAAPRPAEAPRPGEAVAPPEDAPAAATVMEVGEQPAAPLAPDADILVAASDLPNEIAPVADRIVTPAASRPNAPQPETAAPESTPAPKITDAAQPRAQTPDAAAPTPVETEASAAVTASAAPSPTARPAAPTPETAAPASDPAPEIAAAAAPARPADEVEAMTPPTPEDAPAPTETAAAAPPPAAPSAPTPDATEPVEPELTKLNDPGVPAPKLSPPPATKPRALAEAAKATRLAQAAAADKTGAVKQAEAPAGGGTSRTVGKLSFRDKDALRVGIKNYFNPPSGLRDEDRLAVVIRVELGKDGKISGRPKVRRPAGRLDAQHRALAQAGVRALVKSAASGVFARLPKDKYARWRLIDVTFTPREIRFL